MSDLKLESLRIQNFRTFKDLTIDRLGRVNLIVGKNNVGKTALLEAIEYYSKGGEESVLKRIMRDRNLQRFDEARGLDESITGIEITELRNLFHGRPDFSRVTLQDESNFSPEPREIEISSRPKSNKDLILVLTASTDEETIYTHLPGGIKDNMFGEPCRVILSYSRRDMRPGLEEMWDEIEQTYREDKVIEAAKIVEPNLANIRLRQYDGHRRVPVARLEDKEEPEPLGSLGDGVNRMFGIAMALAYVDDGILLVDEIENGLHYSVQPDLWRMIFETARELNVQVFATTHSYDCVQAFQQVSGEHEEEGMLISLRRKRCDPKAIVAVPIEEEELEYAVETHTDVR